MKTGNLVQPLTRPTFYRSTQADLERDDLSFSFPSQANSRPSFHCLRAFPARTVTVTTSPSGDLGCGNSRRISRGRTQNGRTGRGESQWASPLAHPTNDRLTAGNPILENDPMAGKIIIERLEFQGRCGVTPEERRRPQPLAVDLELECQTEPASTSDDIHHAVDYAQVADRVIEIAATQHSALLETFAERLLTLLFAEFPIERAKIWVRKLAPPLEHVTGSVGVQLERSRLAHQIQDAGPTPARFLTQQLHRLPKGKALDVAAGPGRNALYLASHGFHVDAMDRDEQVMAQLAATAKQRNLPNLNVRTVDLERTTDIRPEFPKQEYDVIIVFF